MIDNEICLLGYVNVNGVYYDGTSELDGLYEILTNDIALERTELTGSFLIKLAVNESFFIITDCIRSFPFFYFWDEHKYKWSIKFSVDNKFGGEHNGHLLYKDFDKTGYCTGEDTLLEGVFQGESCTIYDFNKNGEIHKKCYFEYKYSNQDSLEIARLHKVHLSVMASAIKFCGNRQIVVPLSGGFDSRLIVTMLKELGVKNVITFTYGKKNNEEALVSQKIALDLGFQWHFVEYTKSKWLEFTINKDSFFDDFFDYCSIPHIQDYLAVKELANLGYIEPDAVFIPGHSADFLEGTHIPLDILHSKKLKHHTDELITAIVDKHYSLFNFKSMGRDEIYKYLNIEKGFIVKEEFIRLYELWNFKERQSKFISNSVGIYRKMGFESILPLWDKRLVDYWLSVPLSSRANRKHYLDYADVYDEYYNKKQSSYNGCRVKLKSNRYFRYIKKVYVFLYNLNFKKTDYLCFYAQYGFFKVFFGFFLGATSINSFILKDIIKYMDRKPR